MTMNLYLAFVLASTILILIPGPNVAVIVGTSIRHGTRSGLITVAGTSAAQAIQVAVTVLGMTALLILLSQWFEWLRWAGVAYLVYLGVRQWRAAPDNVEQPSAPAAPPLMWRGFVVSLSNPKTMLFHAAFLPQFIDAAGDPAAQLALLAVTFVVIAAVLDSVWALLAGHVRGVFNVSGMLLNRLSGSLFIGAGIGLALVRRS